MRTKRRKKQSSGYLGVMFLFLFAATVVFAVQGLDIKRLTGRETGVNREENADPEDREGNNKKDSVGAVAGMPEDENRKSDDKEADGASGAEEMVATFAQSHNLQLNEWPTEMLELLLANPDATEFVLNYPLKKNEMFTIDLSGYRGCKSVPLLFQWDERWGYTQYGDNVMGLTGCGPTCLSMVCIYLLEDTKYDPKYIAEFSVANGYCVPGSGSAWTLISRGGEKLGLDVIEIPLDEHRIIRNLEVGNPIICIMGPGDFTTTGHFIVMTEYVDGKIKVNDPNSKVRSEMLWEFEDIKDQIRNLWVCR